MNSPPALRFVLGTLAFFSAFVARADERPNVVMILSDDQAWNDYGFMGHETIKTPNLDRLASQSVTFTRGYVPTSLCRPSLATIITGLYPHAHRISGNDPKHAGGKRPWNVKNDPEYDKLRARLIANIDRVPTLPHHAACGCIVARASHRRDQLSGRDNGSMPTKACRCSMALFPTA